MPAQSPGPPIRFDEAPAKESGVWGVRNYYTTLERRAIAGAAMTGGYLAMVVVSAVMATGGLLLNSSAIVIGSMCVAPFMAPSRAVCIGLMFRNWRVFGGGLVKQLFGLLVIGAGVAIVITTVLNQSVAGVAITPEVMLRAMPTPRDVVLSTLVAVAAGAAASLALVTQPRVVEAPWGQVMDAVIGVEIAISLIPPAAVIGIGLALGAPEYSEHAFFLLMLNVVGLDVVGSLAILLVRGIDRRHLDTEKRIREAVAVTLDVVPGFISVDSTVDIMLLDEKTARIDVVLRRHFGGKVPETLADTIASDVASKTACQCDVRVEVIPLLVHDTPRVS